MKGGETPETAVSLGACPDSELSEMDWWKLDHARYKFWGSDYVGHSIPQEEPALLLPPAAPNGVSTAWACIATAIQMGLYTPPKAKLPSRECACGIDRRDCRYHCEDESRRSSLAY
jgi:hypothetical protein